MDPGLSAAAAGQLARRILAAKDEVAREVTNQFYRRHPEWEERFGEEGRRRGLEDAVFHQEFLAGAVRLRDLSTFTRYVRWTVGVLASRGIAPRFLAEFLEQTGEALGRCRLSQEEAAVVLSFLQAGIAEARADAHREPPPLEELEGVPEVYLGALLAGSPRAALGAMDEALKQGWTVPDLYLKVIQAAQYRLGDLWMSNRISVAQEHMASAITQRVLAHLYPLLPEPSQRRGRAVISGVEGEMHQIGANMVADILEADGWEVRFLGTHLPHRDIVQSVRDDEPKLVGISATLLPNLSAVADLIQRLRQLNSSPSLRIVVGGGAFRHSERAWQEVGADGFAPDLLAAREVARTLHASPEA